MLKLIDTTVLATGSTKYRVKCRTGEFIAVHSGDRLLLSKPPSLRSYYTKLDPDEDVMERLRYMHKTGLLPYGKTKRKSSVPRDSQKARLYKAESQVPGWGEDLIAEIVDVQHYVNEIVQSAWWRKQYPDVTYIDVKDSTHHGSPARRGRAYPTKRLIRLPPFARHPMYIIHEMAHVAENPQGKRETAGHGPEFCRVYLDIVQYRLGQECATQLQSRMDWNKVRYD